MSRYQDWPIRLEQFLRSVVDRPFAWGEWDCGAFVSGAICSVTGANPGGQIKGKYSSEREFMEFAPDGVVGLTRRLLWVEGFEEIDPKFAGRGDVVVIPYGEDGHITAVVTNDPLFAAAPGPEGLRLIHTRAATHAWRVD